MRVMKTAYQNDLKIMGTSLKRTLGLTSLIAIGVGLVIGPGAFVSILQGVGLGGPAFFVAMLIAFVLTLGHVFTFTELSLMMPKAGGISTYTQVAAIKI
jgi:amino acid transporter